MRMRESPWHTWPADNYAASVSDLSADFLRDL